MVSAMNFKAFDRGSIRGFFDLRYHGLAIKGCRLLSGNNGLWIAFPQQKGTDDQGQVQYFDQMFLTSPESRHVRRVVLADLQVQGHIQAPAKGSQRRKQASGNRQSAQRQGTHRTPEGEDLDEYYSQPDDDDIPF